MVVNKDIEKKDWVSSFQTKLIKVLKKMPIWVNIRINPNSCILEYTEQNLDYLYFYNFEETVGQNIFNIREWVTLNWCPRLVNKLVSRRAPTSDEIAIRMDLQKNDPSIDPFSQIEEITERELFVERMMPNSSIVILTGRDLAGTKSVFKLKYPITKFISSYYTKWTEEEATKIFFENAEFLYNNTPGEKNDKQKI